MIVGWGNGAAQPLHKSASNTRAVGAKLGMVMDNIKNNGGYAASRIYCVGHSLGAHLCGHAGRWTSVGRITGKSNAISLGFIFMVHCLLKPIISSLFIVASQKIIIVCSF